MARTLVLNATYEPICVVPCPRALVLVISERSLPDPILRCQENSPAIIRHADISEVCPALTVDTDSCPEIDL